MPRKVKIKPGLKQVTLPNGRIYAAGDEVVLTDAQYARLTGTAKTALLLDLGAVADPEVDASFATDAELAAHASDVLLHASGQELAYAENITGTTQTITTTAADVPGCVIVVPISARPVWVEASGIFDITTAPLAATTGTMQLSIMDEANGFVGTTILSTESGNTSGYFTAIVRARLGPVTSAKTLRVQANRGGSTFACALSNGAIASVFRTYIAAFTA